MQQGLCSYNEMRCDSFTQAGLIPVVVKLVSERTTFTSHKFRRATHRAVTDFCLQDSLTFSPDFPGKYKPIGS